jgi:hypothetical protein
MLKTGNKKRLSPETSRSMMLLLSPAIDAPRMGFRVNGLGLFIIAGVIVVALAKFPPTFLGCGAVAAGIFKLAKVLHRKPMDMNKSGA